MNIYIVIPAHNEEAFIGLTLDSLVKQTLLPKKVVVVNDNSTDNTQNIVEGYSTKHNWIELINSASSNQHLPGAKVIKAFYKGYNTLDENYDVICKFDADIILPENYLKSVLNLFKSDKKVGIAGGLAYIKENGKWIYETISSQNHVRGPFKAYSKNCFKAIGGLKESIGWDTVDVLLAQYHGFTIKTKKTLHIKHLKPTGENYDKEANYLQGEALYKMRYGFILTTLFAARNALSKKSVAYFYYAIKGYFKAKEKSIDHIVNQEEGVFIRRLLWKNIFKKLNLF